MVLSGTVSVTPTAWVEDSGSSAAPDPTKGLRQ